MQVCVHSSACAVLCVYIHAHSSLLAIFNQCFCVHMYVDSSACAILITHYCERICIHVLIVKGGNLYVLLVKGCNL